MKNLKTLIVILAISLSTTFSTNATEKNTLKTKEIRTEIVSILGDNISLDLKKPSTAEVSFMINNKNEIVVISIDCDVKELNDLLKRKLNYKKIDVKGAIKGEIYKMPLKIKTK